MWSIPKPFQIQISILIFTFLLATYGGPSTLPLVLADKCDGATCSTITSDLDVVKACFSDPTDANNCRGE